VVVPGWLCAAVLGHAGKWLAMETE